MEKNKNIKLDFVRNNSQDYYRPEFKEVRGRPWIPYGSSTNEYALNLIELKNSSALHGRIIKTKSMMIASEDFIKEGVDQNTLNFINKPNKYENLHKIFSKCAYDLTTFGMNILEIIWDRTHTRILEIYHVDASKVLWGPENEQGFVDHYWFSKDWEQYRRNGFYPIRKERFGTSEERSEFLVSVPDYEPGVLYYTYPDYEPGYVAITIDAQIMNFHKSNLENNFEPGKMLTFITDDPSDEERQINRELFEEKHTGTDEAGRTIINYSEDKDSAPIIQLIGDDGNHSKYLALDEASKSDIITAHGITSPLLVGISTPGSLGGGQELIIAQELFYKYAILPKRKSILNTFNDLGKINGLQPIDIEDNRVVIEQMSQNITINNDGIE